MQNLVVRYLLHTGIKNVMPMSPTSRPTTVPTHSLGPHGSFYLSGVPYPVKDTVIWRLLIFPSITTKPQKTLTSSMLQPKSPIIQDPWHGRCELGNAKQQLPNN